ncbi:MAG: NADH-quinone oxidoreductase subunit NuoF [Armatimonadota bacterium]
MAAYRSHVIVCAGAGCVSSGCRAVSDALQAELVRQGLDQEIKVVQTGCVGSCDLGPVVIVYPEGVFYQRLKAEDVPEIVESHLLKGRPAERLLYRRPSTGELLPTLDQIDFFSKQEKIVLRNCGVIDPANIEEYIARDGYQALAKVLTEMKPEQVIDEVKASGLRGRGGAGFPTGMKWDFVRKAAGSPKYVVCNADEGDPGAFMDRSVLEGDPHSVIEAMTIAGYAVGSSQGYVYVRAEYPLAVERLSHAIKQAREQGLLGKNIFGTGFDFDLDIRMGAGAFVCGEETALMASLEGRRGEPRPRPPFPAQAGLWNKPTLLNNVETYANIAPIILKGAAWYAGFGTEKSKGTKVFALAGDINNTGLVEVPMGTPLGTIIYDIGGGIRNDRKFKAAQTGGPSGGCIPKEMLNTPVDYESLKDLGAIMGSGGLIVMDEDTCMVDLARFFLDFVQDESCGKCTPCRIGTKRMLEIVTRITEGRGKEGDIELLEELGRKIAESALCGLGQTAPNPVLSTIRYFRHEYEAHIKEKRCPAVVCKSLYRAPCEHTCPAGINVPIYIGQIANGDFDGALNTIRSTMPFAAVCGRVCHHPCESKCLRGQLDEPLAVGALKRFAADYVAASNGDARSPLPAPNGHKAAVVGGGPAGLSAAWELAKRGYAVKLFEALPVLGGMLSVGIPEYRLPKKALQREIDDIIALGVDVQTGVRVGTDITFDQLMSDGYDAIFVGVGAWKSTPLGIPGEDLPGVMHAINLLRDANLALMDKGEMPKIGKKVAVIGGGNAAIDAARTAVRVGAKEVHIVYRRTRDEMPAQPKEIAEAIQEGVQMHFLAGPKQVLGKRRVTGLECYQMELKEFDRSGRRRPVQVEGADFTLDVDTVIAAIGQSVESSVSKSPLTVDRWGQIEVDPRTLATNIPGVYAGGDAVLGPSTVIEAVAQGLKAARMIDQQVRGVPAEAVVIEDERGPLTDDEDVIEKARLLMPELRVCDRVSCFAEVELGYTAEAAQEEANRCLKCHLAVQ